MNYIIVQAGGKGSRMEQLTRNKPKALVPVNNLPMIFHLFKKYPDKHYIIIGDYKCDVLERYLAAFATVDYKLVSGTGHEGTCAGLQKALDLLPENERFMLIWCDLILPADYSIPNTKENIVGISKDFVCRWMYEDGTFREERSAEHGVAGHFIFKSKKEIEGVPESGEFVRWLSEKNIRFIEQPLYKTREYGLISEWNKLPKMRCRPFNKMTIVDDRIVKEAIDEQERSLAKREISWYKKISETSFAAIPQIYSYESLIMEKIDGKNVFEYSDLPQNEKENALACIVSSLKQLHALESVPYDETSYRNAYLGKTFERLKKIQDLVPFAKNASVKINGKTCRNIFYCSDAVEKMVMDYAPKKFVMIHGDPTFSNIVLKNGKTPIFIDPRGYFGKTDFFGDVAYDWVKLYYSLVSNYDQFNTKQFDLSILEDEVELKIASSHWENLEETFFNLIGDEVSRKQMKILLAIIWLSLTTYAWEDYDSICGAFYNGLLYLEDAFNEK